LTRALLITGTIGVGKTVAAIEVGERLQERGIAAAVIDLDWLCWLCSPVEDDDQIGRVLGVNLAAVIPGFLEAGVSRFVLARAVRDRSDLDPVREGLGDVPLHTLRLEADPAVIATRLAARHQGDALVAHIVESAVFTDRLDAMTFDSTVRTDGLDVAATAHAILDAAGW